MDRTNETATGYSYGGQSYKKESRTDSQGNTYTVDIPVSNVIPVSSLSSQTPTLKFPQPSAPVDYNQQTIGITSPYMEASQMQNDLAKQQSEVSDIQALQRTLSGKSAFEAEQAQALGLNTASEDYIKKQAELSALNKQAAAAQQENIAQGRQLGSVASFVAGQGNEIERNRAIRALTIGAELDALQGNIAVAQMKVKNAVDAKYASVEQDIKNRLQMFELNSKVMQNRSEAEQKAWERAKYAVEREDKKIQEKKAEENEVGKMLVDARSVGTAEAKAAADKAQRIFEQGGSKLAVAQALGVYGGDYLKNELLKEQLKTEKAQRDKIYSDINKNKTPLVTGKDGIIATLPKAQQDRYYKLQGDFDKATEKYRGAIDAAGSLSALAENATAQDQTAIIFQYMKTLDPTSTVREGEFALVASTAGLGDRAINAIKKLDNGQRLNEQQINEIVGAANKLAGDARKNISGTEKEYDRRASIGGLPSGLFKSEAQQVDETEDYATNVLNKLNQTFNQTPKTFLQTLTGQ